MLFFHEVVIAAVTKEFLQDEDRVPQEKNLKERLRAFAKLKHRDVKEWWYQKGYSEEEIELELKNEASDEE